MKFYLYYDTTSTILYVIYISTYVYTIHLGPNELQFKKKIIKTHVDYINQIEFNVFKVEGKSNYEYEG